MTMSGRLKPLSRLAAMRGRTRKSLLVCVFALTLAGCGGDSGTIPPQDANTLLNELKAVRTDVESGDCDTAQQHAQELIGAVAQLPNDVDPDVASELTKASEHLDQLASTQCTGASGLTGVQPSTSTTSTTTVEPTETSTTETSTTTQEQTSDQPPTEPQGGDNAGQQPPAGGQDQGGQGGNPTPTPTPTPGGGVPPSGGVTPGGGSGGG
ncbi:MAG: hypothetical protein QOI10_533 [Solirubrobacterales bacterium]|jgi:hypothetical protein|nr:hypothetical protein [Solirubrobacterales bacterium]